MNFGRAIRIARAARGLSQKDVAGGTGLTASYISLIEAERRTPSAKAVQRIGQALGVPPHLMALLAADQGDLSALSAEQSATLGRDLLDVLTLAGGR